MPPLPISYPGAGGQQPRPTPTSVRFELKGATAVNALQATLGELLLAGGREVSGERVAERVPAE